MSFNKELHVTVFSQSYSYIKTKLWIYILRFGDNSLINLHLRTRSNNLYIKA